MYIICEKIGTEWIIINDGSSLGREASIFGSAPCSRSIGDGSIK